MSADRYCRYREVANDTDAGLAERGMRVECGSGNIAVVTLGNVVTEPDA
jgi:hypothetical protein